MDASHGRIPHRFQIHGLPNAADRGIPAAHEPPTPVLLAPGLGAVRLILHPEAQVIHALLQQGGNVHGKGGVSTDMLPGMLPIHIHICLEIHCAEPEQHPLALHVLRQGERTTIPQEGMNLIRGAKTAHLGLIGKGYQNFFIQWIVRGIPLFRKASIFIIKGELPKTVQVAEGIPLKIRTGMLRTGKKIVHKRNLSFSITHVSLLRWPAQKCPEGNTSERTGTAGKAAAWTLSRKRSCAPTAARTDPSAGEGRGSGSGCSRPS